MKLFTKVKEIVSRTGEMHFERWAIIESKLFSLYLHRIHKADRDHLHSHPWNFISVILKGSYVEEVKTERLHKWNLKQPFVVGYTNKKWFHKIDSILNGPIYTLVFVWGGNFDGDRWHYLVGNKVVPFKNYRDIKTFAKSQGKSIEQVLESEKWFCNQQA